MNIHSSAPKQAVILAGGRGTRLRPLTDSRPKPMIEFHGKPFLEHLLVMLRQQGIERVLLLLGYLPHVIRNYFGDGQRLGLRITYSTSDPDNLTGRRLRIAYPLIDECFLLLYCDNFWPMQMQSMWDRFRHSNAPAMVTVYTNRDRYTRDCVRVGSDGYIEVFDRTRMKPGLRGVEISYAIMRRTVLDLLPQTDDVLFEEAVYPVLAASHQLLAFETDHRYYSVGSLERLPVTETFLKPQRAVILDRDGVLNRKPAAGEYVCSANEFQWLSGAKEALRNLNEAGYRILVASNQAGIARNQLTESALAEIHARMIREAEEAGGRIDRIYYCPHHWTDGCECRKPKPGMLFQAQKEFHLDLTRTPFVGDDERDAEAAKAAGCPAVLLSPNFTLADYVGSIAGRQHASAASGFAG